MQRANANPISEKIIVPEFTCLYVDISFLKNRKLQLQMKVNKKRYVKNKIYKVMDFVGAEDVEQQVTKICKTLFPLKFPLDNEKKKKREVKK